jgi:hypothetical protein
VPKQKNWFFCITLAIFLLAWFPAANEYAFAQGQTGVTLKAEAGFDGYAREATWIPVRISVENKGADAEARVNVFYKDYTGNATIYSADVSLPTNSRKEFFIYFYYPRGGVSKLFVELTSKDKVVAKTSLQLTNLVPQSMLVGLMTDSPSTYNIISQITTTNGVTRLAQIEPSTLPEMAQGLESLDAIIVSGTDTGQLSANQKQALELWVAKGGILFVAGGPKWQTSVAGLQNLLPIQVTGTTSASTEPELAGYTNESFPAAAVTSLATGKLTKDAAVLAEQSGHPLIIERQIGRGKSIFFAADPSLAPYKNWDGMEGIYQELFGFKPVQAAWANGQWDPYNSTEALTTLAELDIPSIYFICGWLAIYIVLIGPVNYIVLRVLKKLEWAWVTIPVIVVMVTGVSYIYGFLYRGNTPTLNRINVIQAWDGVSQAESRTLVGVYSPQRKKYTIESADNFLLYPFNSESLNIQGGTQWLSVQQETNTVTPDIPIEIGGMKILAASGMITPPQFTHNLTVELDDLSSLTGTITNSSDLVLHDAMLVTPAAWERLGDLNPGQTKQIDLSLVDTTSVFYNLDAYTILNQTYYSGNPVDEQAARKNALLRAVITPEYGENNLNWGIYLMGWLDEPPPSASLKDQSPKTADTTFYILEINPATSNSTSDVTISAPMFEWETSSPDFTPYYTYGGSGPYIYKFRPAVPLQFSEVKDLTLQLDSYVLPTDLIVSLWDYTIGDWAVIDNMQWGNKSVPDPERYVNSRGEVKLSIASPQNAYVEMRRSTIQLTVSP